MYVCVCVCVCACTPPAMCVCLCACIHHVISVCVQVHALNFCIHDYVRTYGRCIHMSMGMGVCDLGVCEHTNVWQPLIHRGNRHNL